MAYIGKQPVVGNFQVCDAISVVNGQAAYTMQVASTNVEPESANHMLVSLNGILQKPGSSFTISGATITFASNLVTNDVIDFIILLGDTLNVGTPSDDTVGAAQIKADLISGTTALTSAPDDTDEFLVSDAGTLKRIDYSLIKSAGLNLISTTTVSSGTSTVDITGMDSTYKNYKIIVSNLHPATDDVSINVRFIIGGSAQSGTNYNYVNHRILQAGTPGHVLNSSASANATKLMYGGLGNAAHESLFAEITIPNPSETTFRKIIQAHSSFVDPGGDSAHNINTTFYTDGTAALTGLQFLTSSGNIDSGIFKLYGIS